MQPSDFRSRVRLNWLQLLWKWLFPRTFLVFFFMYFKSLGNIDMNRYLEKNSDLMLG